MKLIDKVWLACAIDSEGWMGYYRRGFNQWGIPNVGIACAVGNSDRHYMEKCAHLMGSIRLPHYTSRKRKAIEANSTRGKR